MLKIDYLDALVSGALNDANTWRDLSRLIALGNALGDDSKNTVRFEFTAF